MSKVDDEFEKKWQKACRSELSVGHDIKFGRDELAHYFFGQAEYNHGGDVWRTYRTTTFDLLRIGQNDDGSWPSGDGISVGSVYATAVWCTVLQLDKDRHPSIQRHLDDVK